MSGPILFLRGAFFLFLLAPGLLSQGKTLTVVTVQPVLGDVARTRKLPGFVRPFEKVLMHAKVTGYAATVYVDRGSRVKTGTLLLKLSLPEMEQSARLLQAEKNEARARVAIAEAIQEQKASLGTAAQARVDAARSHREARQVAVDFARKKAVRFRHLAQSGSVTPLQLDEAELALKEALAEATQARADLKVAAADAVSAEAARARAAAETRLAQRQLESAQARLERQRIMLRYGEIRAPFDGLVTERLVDTGALVLGGEESSRPTPLFRLLRTDKLRVVVPVPEEEIALLHPGLSAVITGVGLGGQALQGRVTLVTGALSASNRTMPVELFLSDPRLVPGMSVYAQLKLEVHKQVLTLPSQALHWKKKTAFVWVVTQGQAQELPVQVGFNDLVRAEVRGLSRQAQVIVSSREPLKPGRKVRGETRKGGER